MWQLTGFLPKKVEHEFRAHLVAIRRIAFKLWPLYLLVATLPFHRTILNSTINVKYSDMENAMVRMRHTTELSRLFLIFSLVKIEFRKKSLSASFLSALTVSHFFFLDLPQSLLSSLYLWSSSSFWLQLLHSLLAVPMLTCFYSSLLINGKTKFASLFILCFTIFLNQLSVCINS